MDRRLHGRRSDRLGCLLLGRRLDHLYVKLSLVKESFNVYSNGSIHRIGWRAMTNVVTLSGTVVDIYPLPLEGGRVDIEIEPINGGSIYIDAFTAAEAASKGFVIDGPVTISVSTPGEASSA
jgi:hypothetical protein